MRVPELVFPGSPAPLGATWDGSGVNFALFSEHATRVDLCIFDAPYGRPEVARIPLVEQTDNVWHAYLPEARPGLQYGFRCYGPYDPANGLRFNPQKLLIDPYARQLTGPVQWSDAMFGYPFGDGEDRDLGRDDRDSGPGMPKSIVIDSGFSWGDDRAPCIPWNRTIIYETHVRGMTIRDERLPAEIRGTYEGLAHHRTVRYLQELGVTAVELMPVHHFVDDHQLVQRGLKNYWGYNTIGFFAPDTRYATNARPGGAVQEFKTMVKTLHQAGMEVILDVVYNHTAEGNHLGPTLSFRGIDNPAYYRLAQDDRRHYVDYTGTGNTLNMLHPRAIQIIMDSLRYWVLEMHVDGFRFDLASTLARELHDVDRLSAFFDIIHQDPVLSRVKLIAEPWDLGDGGYQVGNFPVLWTEWNGKYRDLARRFWRGDPGQLAELGYRLSGSSDLYSHSGRKPYASINFVTAHDGFTLHDLVSYNGKHNEANGEGNRDGSDDNLSWNCGVEGETDDPVINELRDRQSRNFLATLFLSQGVPMLAHGDEAGRRQHGNNNAYCQDNAIAWMDWSHGPREEALLRWTKRIINFRRAHPVLWRKKFFEGQFDYATATRDITWFGPDAREMREADWRQPERHSLGALLSGSAPDLTDDRGWRIEDHTLFIALHAGEGDIAFRLPRTTTGGRWTLEFDTSRPELPSGVTRIMGRRTYSMRGRSLAVFSCPPTNGNSHQ